MPRPTLCTPEIIAAICRHLVGPPPTTLARALRRELIDKSTYYDWRKRAARGEQPYADAVADVEDARDELKAHLLDRVSELSESGGKEDATRLNATKWLLEKLYREDFDPPKQVELSGRDGGAIEHRVTADELCAALDAIAGVVAARDDSGGTPPGDG